MEITVISSNFIAFMLILNMAMNIHLTVKIFTIKKREIRISTKKEAVLQASKKMIMPILYTVLTTICAFLSLIFSGIKPIIDFGWMMTLGLIISISITFFLLPSLLSIFSSDNEIDIKIVEKSKITGFLGNLAKNNRKTVFGISILIIVVSIFRNFEVGSREQFYKLFR